MAARQEGERRKREGGREREGERDGDREEREKYKRRKTEKAMEAQYVKNRGLYATRSATGTFCASKLKYKYATRQQHCNFQTWHEQELNYFKPQANALSFDSTPDTWSLNFAKRR